MVLPRILTSVVLIPLVVACVWAGSLPFFFFVLGVSLFCLWEYSLITAEGGYPNQFILSMVGGVLIVLSIYIDGMPTGPLHAAPSPVFILIVWVFVLFVREFFRRDKSNSFLIIITTVTGLLLCAFFLGHLLLIRDLRLAGGEGLQLVGRPFLFFLMLVIWAADTGAWMVGRSFGRFHLAPSISPKKTWEGAVGGALLACLVGWFMREVWMNEMLGRSEAVLFAFLISIVAQCSDLAESLLKRSCGVKNSSELLPGHGGMLDRFDSFIFAAPFFYYVLVATGRFQ